MLLTLSTWQEIETYLAGCKAVVIPVGSTEQHGPTGLIGTDFLCTEEIAKAAGTEAGFLVAPTFNVGVAQHHMHFPGTLTLRPTTMIAALVDWSESLIHHGFRRLYWLNGHGGNLASVNAAIAEIYHEKTFAAGRPSVSCMVRNWWDLPGVSELCRSLFPGVDGNHATPSEISITRFLFPDTVKTAALAPPLAPSGPIRDAEDFKRRFPDGRIGSDPSRASAEAGARIFAAAVAGLAAEFKLFAAD
jgi:creatinine amidohydrolase